MTRNDAYRDLESADTDTRLRAARYFALNAAGNDRRKLRPFLDKETVPWIKKALDRAIVRATSAVGAEEKTTVIYADPPPRLMAELRASAIDEVAGTIIHELATIVASLKLRVPREVPNYQGSRTETLVNSLDSLLTGIRNLKTAASKADYAECDLARECRDACALFADAGDIFRFGGPSPFMVEIDPNLFKLALTNVIKNAVEAVIGNRDEGDRLVTLNWGRAGHEHWVAVIDNGAGFEREPGGMVEFGRSTKDEHIGFGLATAKQAMQAMEGDVYPANARAGGARIELRWFSSDENSVR